MFLSLVSHALQLQRRRRRKKSFRSGAPLHQFGHQNMQNVHKLTEKVLRSKLCHEVVCGSRIAREKDGIVPWGDALPSFLPSFLQRHSQGATTTTRNEGEAFDDPQSSIVGKPPWPYMDRQMRTQKRYEEPETRSQNESQHLD